MQACAFTGHRPQRFSFGYDESVLLCQEIKKALLTSARKLYIQKNVRRFLVGGAIGADMWAAEAVIELMAAYDSIQLFCVSPFRGHDANWPPVSRQRLRNVLKKAEACYLQECYSKDAYARRNHYLIDNANYLVALYDMNTSTASGTGQTVRYAQSKGQPIILINPDHASISYWYPGTTRTERLPRA